jgi:two-component system, sensor histidine kinase
MEQRVLIWASGRDGSLTSRFLSDAGFEPLAVGSCADCCRELEAGAGVLILAEEALSHPQCGSLREILARQPAWSDIPVIIIASRSDHAHSHKLFADLSSVSVLHRPLSLDTLCSTVGAGLRARRRQYQVRDLLQQREEFLAMMAHELRNPLSPIKTGLQLLRITESEEQRERIRAMLERQAGNLSRMIDDLLDVSRITRGKIRLQRRTIDVEEALRHAIDARRRQAAEKGLAITFEPPLEPVWVDADPTRLEQMIDNVLSNAIKFTPARGSIEISARRENGEVVMSVKDTGIGIPRHLLATVFELFAQADRELDRTQGGLGIGLTVVKNLAALHGGSAAAFSEGEGKGTTVELRLPAVKDASRIELPVRRPMNGESGHRRRVLIVEDNRDAAEMLADYLRRQGHVVVIAHSGDAGLAMCEREPPDVAICDIGLPGLNGYELARALRTRERLRHCLLIAVTGYGERRDRERGLQAGFHHYLVKPADPEAIADLIRRHDDGASSASGEYRRPDRPHPDERASATPA